MIDMVGIGPFITIPFIVGLLHGPVCIIAWLIGALLAYSDGMVWAELGARWPEAGGSYVFLQKLFGNKWGKLMAFLFIFQTVIQAPLVIASGAIGFSQYLTYLVPLSELQQKAVSGGLVILLVALLYRNIKSVGKISVILAVITGGTMLWLILSGIGHFHPAQAFDFSIHGFDGSALLFVAIGQASLKAIYSYMGYYNICQLGGEIRNPSKNIPRSILISVTGVAILYLCMQTVIIGVLPASLVAHSSFIASTYFEHIYNHAAGQIATMLILCIALASLFSVILGYSRIPYAAAKNGDFFPIFARVHHKHKFPHISLLALGGIGFVFSLLFKMQDVITAIVTVRILIQFVSQAIGVIAWHYSKPNEERPYKMPLFPIPAVISITIWLYILFSSKWTYIAAAIALIVAGLALFRLKESIISKQTPQNE